MYLGRRRLGDRLGSTPGPGHGERGNPGAVPRSAVVASKQKLDDIDVLRVDTGDPDLDGQSRGWQRVRIGKFERRPPRIVRRRCRVEDATSRRRKRRRQRAASHRRAAAGLGPSGLRVDECWECNAPITPILQGIRRYLDRFASVSRAAPAGDTCESRTGIPKSSDRPDVGAVVPRFERRSLSSLRKSEVLERPRPGTQAGRTGKNVLTLTRFSRVVRLRPGAIRDLRTLMTA